MDASQPRWTRPVSRRVVVRGAGRLAYAAPLVLASQRLTAFAAADPLISGATCTPTPLVESETEKPDPPKLPQQNVVTSSQSDKPLPPAPQV
ncbi:MAG TPA: hypothetical protein VIL01_08840, partial [Thermomicrobiales bacterium]